MEGRNSKRGRHGGKKIQRDAGMEGRKFKERQAWREKNLKRGRHGGNKIQREAGMEGRKFKERQAWREENLKRGRHGGKNIQSVSLLHSSFLSKEAAPATTR